MELKNVIESQQFSHDWLEGEFFPLAAEMEKIVKSRGVVAFFKYFFPRRTLAGKRMVNLFYQPSTRTRISFEMAMERLGGKTVSTTEHAEEFSGVAKGENIQDTIRVISGYHPDVIILRSPKEGLAKIASQFSIVPIVNAGDGKTGQHPTQALTDILTIKKEKKEIANLVIGLAGDLAWSRTARSLIYIAAKFPGVSFEFISPAAGTVEESLKNHLREHQVPFSEVYDIREVAPRLDVLYSTRIQAEYEETRKVNLSKYGPPAFWTVTKEVMAKMKKDAIVMHPLPRLEEIPSEIDSDPRAVYFKQAENGLYARMALLKLLLKPKRN